MGADDASRGGTMGALREAMDLLEQMPPAGPELRARGYATEADLLGGLDDPDATVRRGCLELLADPRGDDAVPHVIERFEDPAWEVRYTAVHALTREPGTPPGVLSAAISTVHTDSSRYVRMLAVELVANAVRHDPAALEALETVRDADADPAVRRKAARYAPGGVNERDR